MKGLFRALRSLFGGTTPEPAPPGPERLTPSEVKEIWNTGRWYQLFVAQGIPTLNTVTLAKGVLIGRFHGHRDVETIISQAHEVLNAPLYREQWEASRRVMAKVEAHLGRKAFAQREARIWPDLWKETEQRFHLKPDQMTGAVVDEMARKYAAKYK